MNGRIYWLGLTSDTNLNWKKTHWKNIKQNCRHIKQIKAYVASINLNSYTVLTIVLTIESWYEVTKVAEIKNSKESYADFK